MTTHARNCTCCHPLRRRGALTGEDPQRGSLRPRHGSVLNMRWVRGALYRISRFAENQPVQETQELAPSFEDAREAMIYLLGGATNPLAVKVLARACRAANAEALWYLRADLLGALSIEHGEEEARQLVRRITLMLESLVPEGWHSRPSPLMQA